LENTLTNYMSKETLRELLKYNDILNIYHQFVPRTEEIARLSKICFIRHKLTLTEKGAIENRNNIACRYRVFKKGLEEEPNGFFRRLINKFNSLFEEENPKYNW
jgi:hypothetical protein